MSRQFATNVTLAQAVSAPGSVGAGPTLLEPWGGRCAEARPSPRGEYTLTFSENSLVGNPPLREVGIAYLAKRKGPSPRGCLGTTFSPRSEVVLPQLLREEVCLGVHL